MSKKIRSKVDWEDRKIYGKSGQIYHIRPELVASKLWAEYNIRGALLGTNNSLQSIVDRLNKGIDYLRNGKQNAQGNTANALEEFESIKDGFRRYRENGYNAVIEFLSIFCKKTGEPVDRNDETIIAAKYEDWGEIPQTHLFFLSAMSIPSLRENLQKLQVITEEGLPPKTVWDILLEELNLTISSSKTTK